MKEDTQTRNFENEAREFLYRHTGEYQIAQGNEPAHQFASEFAHHLLGGLDEGLTYHNIAHTFNDVTPTARKIADREGWNGKKKLILERGAELHDVGHLIQYDKNEPFGAEIAGQVLPVFGYGSDIIEPVQGIILATDIYGGRGPQNGLDEAMCDADLGHLGLPFDEFKKRSLQFQKEQDIEGKLDEKPHLRSEVKWLADTHAFLNGHQYHRASMRDRQEQKEANFERLRREYVNRN